MARNDRLSADALSARLNRLEVQFENVENEPTTSTRTVSSNSLSDNGFQAGRRAAIMERGAW